MSLAMQLSQHAADFFPGEYGRKPLRLAGTHDPLDSIKRLVQDLVVEKQQG